MLKGFAACKDMSFTFAVGSRMQPELLQGTEHPAVVAGEGQDKLGTRNSHEGLGSAWESCSLG